MKILLAPDSFKGSMSSKHIIELLTQSAKKHFEKCEIISVPMADGGEGTGEHKFTKSGQYFTIPRGRSAEYRGRRTTGTGNPFREMTGRRLGLRSESGHFGLQGPSEAGSRIEQNS